MRRGPKITHNLFVAGPAFLSADKLRAGNTGWREDGAVRFERAARKQNDGQRGRSPDRPQQFLAFTVDRSS